MRQLLNHPLRQAADLMEAAANPQVASQLTNYLKTVRTAAADYARGKGWERVAAKNEKSAAGFESDSLMEAANVIKRFRLPNEGPFRAVGRFIKHELNRFDASPRRTFPSDAPANTDAIPRDPDGVPLWDTHPQFKDD
ncbi:MAG: hypothetical protein ACT4TC_03120 [Myxococcaceae bacterium]